MPADFTDESWEVRDAELAQDYYDREVLGKTVKQARAAVVDALRETGALIGDVRAITHPVKFYEKGERPLEIVTSRQWFVRTLEHRDELLARGEELRWHPEYMRHRYRSWVEGLNVDWNISRQRFFGVPFPAWYPVDAGGEVNFDQLMVAGDESLPVDPSSDVPAGYREDQRGQPGGFVGDPDVMDTWATSSLSPQIAGRWGTELFQRVFPMDLRPQAHDIIRTWLFATVVRSHLQFNSLPFSDALISGFILDPDRKKMSKSFGNSVTPMPLVEQYGADALRYWAAGGRPGSDTAFDDGQLKIGRRLGIKILNASKFVLGRLDGEIPGPSDVTEPIDLDLLALLAKAHHHDDRRLRELRLRARPGTHGEFLLVVLRRLRRVGEDPRLRRQRRSTDTLRARHARPHVVSTATPVRADNALRHRRGLALVARPLRPYVAVADIE